MKRTPFKKKPYQWKRKPPKTKKGLFDHLKKESKNDEWTRIKRDILDPYFQKHNLYSVCELQLDRCIGAVLPLQYAHSKKRGEIALEEPERTRELCEVIRACTNCHKDIEYLPEKDGVSGHEQMYQIVTSVIKTREKRLSRWQKVGA